MKKLMCLLTAATILLFSLTACGEPKENSGSATADHAYKGEDLSDTERVVNVYNWGEYVSPGDEGTVDVIEEFEKATGIKVNYTNFESNEELYNVLTNSNSSYDVIIPSDYMIARLRGEGRLLELNYDNIPNITNINERFRGQTFDPDDLYSVPYSWGFVALVYNTKMIDEGEIKGFKDMWNPKYRDSVLMFNNPRDAMAIAMQVCDPKINPGKESFTSDDIIRAHDKLVELKECGSLKKYVMDQVFNQMEDSQAALAPYYAGDISTMMDNNEDLDYVIPEEGSNLFIDAMCIPDCCKHKKNAEIFINFMCEPEIAAANAEYIYYGTPNNAALELMDEDYRESELTNPPEEFLKNCYTFTNIDDKSYDLMQEYFVKACTGKAENASRITVVVFLAVIILATLVLSVLTIRRAIKNRGRIQKL